MDWLDNYLDGLGQYKVTVSPADTHVWGVKPKLNNVQQKMLFDAAAQSELEYRLLVQEARQAEIDAGMGGSYDAGSAAREGQVTPAAPTTLPLSTPNLYFSGLTFGTENPDVTNVQFKNPYERQSNTTWQDQAQGFEGNLQFYQGFWILYASADLFNPDEGWVDGYVQVCYCASNGSSIPLNGWVNGGGNINVTGTLVISTTQ